MSEEEESDGWNEVEELEAGEAKESRRGCLSN